jgi:hypothetical protein
VHAEGNTLPGSSNTLPGSSNTLPGSSNTRTLRCIGFKKADAHSIKPYACKLQKKTSHSLQ